MQLSKLGQHSLIRNNNPFEAVDRIAKGNLV